MDIKHWYTVAEVVLFMTLTDV